MSILTWVTEIRNAVASFAYRFIAKPLFFAQDPEVVHDRMIRTGRILGATALGRGLTTAAFGFSAPNLGLTVNGLHFRSPIGLSAGFDKHGEDVNIMGPVGFGFMEVGSVTGVSGPGNSKPRLWRLPESRGLVVNYGLNSVGSAVVAERLRQSQASIPVGVSIAKANLPSTDDLEAGIADYRQAAKDLAPLADFMTINISCPNTTGGEPFAQPDHLRQLLTAVWPDLKNKPTYIKLPPDLDEADFDAMTDAAAEFPISGFIISNLTKDRHNPAIKESVVPPKGGMSGKIVEQRSNAFLLRARQRYGSRFTLIGLGGIFTAADAYRKIRLGASLVQLFTGMIYQGPQTASTISLGLSKLLKRDGFSSPLDAVGIDA